MHGTIDGLLADLVGRVDAPAYSPVHVGLADQAG